MEGNGRQRHLFLLLLRVVLVVVLVGVLVLVVWLCYRPSWVRDPNQDPLPSGIRANRMRLSSVKQSRSLTL